MFSLQYVFCTLNVFYYILVLSTIESDPRSCLHFTFIKSGTRYGVIFCIVENNSTSPVLIYLLSVSLFVSPRNHFVIYYIQSSEIQENIVDIYCIFYIFTSENIKSYIFTPQECTYNFFGLPLTFPLNYCSALQNFKCL